MKNCIKICLVFLCAFLAALISVAGIFSIAFAEGASAESWEKVVLIGDTDTKAMLEYAESSGFMPKDNICFCEATSACVFANNLKNLIGYEKDGQYQDIITVREADTVCLMFGKEDHGHDFEDCRAHYKDAIETIKIGHPGVKVVVQSAIAATRGSWIEAAEIKAFNRMLSDMCEELSVEYVEVSDGLLEGSGFLKGEYSDDGVYLNARGCGIWQKNLDRELFCAKDN